MAVLELNGNRARSVRLIVPRVGLWVANVTIDATADLSTEPRAASLAIGAAELTGTVITGSTYLVKTLARIVGGSGGWRKLLPKRHYHNDAGVGRGSVLSTTATEAGEVLASKPTDLLQKVDYVRAASRPARQVLDDLAPDWWMSLDGVTQLEARTSAPAAPEILDFDPLRSIATFRIAELGEVGIGSVISGRLPAPMTVQAIEYVIDRDVRACAWLA